MAPNGEVRDGHVVDLVGRDREARSSWERKRRAWLPPRRRTPSDADLPGTAATRRGTPSTSAGGVSSNGPTTNATRYVDISMVSWKRTRRRPSLAGSSLATDALDSAVSSLVNDQGDREDRLELRLVPAREGPPGVGRFELGHGDGVLRVPSSSVNVLR